MKSFTRKQIEDTIVSVSEGILKGNIMNDFCDNTDDFEKIIKDGNIDIAKDEAAIISAYITAMQKGVVIMRETLCKLLCDEE